MARITSEVDLKQVNRLIDNLKSNTSIFTGFSKQDIDQMMEVFKMCHFKKDDVICEMGEPLDMLGLILHGDLKVQNSKKATLQDSEPFLMKPGDMFGHQNLAEQTGNFMQATWKYELKAETDGVIAVFAFGELKTEIRTHSKGCLKLMQMAANYAYETNHFNIRGESSNPTIKFLSQPCNQKPLKRYIDNNPIMKNFLNGMDKKDERILFNELRDKVATLNPGDRVVRRNTQDRALFFVIKGTFFAMNDQFPQEKIIYSAGAVLGSEQFLKNDKWEIDLICREEDSLIAKYDYDSFLGLRESNAMCAIRLYNRIIRQMSYKAIQQSNIDAYFTDQLADRFYSLGLKDKDLLIDLQVGSKREITNMYIANKVVTVKKEEPVDLLAMRQKQDGRQSSLTGGAEMAKFQLGTVGEIFDLPKNEKVTVRKINLKSKNKTQRQPNSSNLDEKGADLNSSMFLSDHYQKLFDEKTERMQEVTRPKSPSLMKTEQQQDENQILSKFYRQKWLQQKLDVQQGKKRKKPVKKDKPADTTEPGKAPPKKSRKKGPEVNKDEIAELEDELGDLKNDLVFQNLEMKNLRDELDMLKAENAELQQKMKKERSYNQSLAATRDKYSTNAEIHQYSEQIQSKVFFENQRNEQRTDIQNNMIDQVIEQQKQNRLGFITRKYGFRWLQYWKDRKRMRQELNFYNQ